MIIEIIKPVPVSHDYRPIVHKRYAVVSVERRRCGTTYFVEVNGQRVGVLSHECKVVSGSEDETEEDEERHKGQLSDDQVQEITAVAGTMLKACVDDYDAAIWDEIGSTVIDDIMECTDLQHGGGFTSGDVALALGRVSTPI